MLKKFFKAEFNRPNAFVNESVICIVFEFVDECYDQKPENVLKGFTEHNP